MTDSRGRSAPLENFIARHMGDIRRCHGLGECGGRPCPYCDYERQFPGKPFYLTFKYELMLKSELELSGD